MIIEPDAEEKGPVATKLDAGPKTRTQRSHFQVVTSKRLHRPDKIIKLRSLSSTSKAEARQGKARRLCSTASPPYHSHPLPTKKLHSRPHSPTKKRPYCISTKKEEDESKLHSH